MWLRPLQRNYLFSHHSVLSGRAGGYYHYLLHAGERLLLLFIIVLRFFSLVGVLASRQTRTVQASEAVVYGKKLRMVVIS